MGSYAPTRPTKYCQTCGTVIDAMAVVCTHCGVMQPLPTGYMESEKKILPAVVLCVSLGVFGAHRFYAGKTATGVLQLVTLGGFGIWTLIDFIRITIGSFKDGDGNRITEWV
jgi:TM2 domain-containing membrane protein YozV